MQILNFKVSNQVITASCPGRIVVAGSRGQVYAQFALDAEWDGLGVVALFSNDFYNSGEPVPVVWNGKAVEVPPEVLVPGRLRVGLNGVGDSGETLIPTIYMQRPIQISRSGGIIVLSESEATPSLWEQLLAMIGNLSNLDTLDKSNLVAAINEVLTYGGAGGAISADAIAAAVETYLKENPIQENVPHEYYLLKSPGGTVYKVTVSDTGVLQVVGEAGSDEIPDDLIAGRLLVWNDDFDGNSIDPEKWMFRLDNPKYYGADDVQISDSILTYPVTYDEAKDQYRHFYMMTSGLMDAKYGRIEARMKWDIGVYTAWWTIGQCQEKYKGETRGIIWPRSGECDIFEDAGDGKLFGTIHWGEIENAGLNQNNTRAYTTTEFDVTQWHRYAVEWTESEYIFYIDDTEVGRADISDIVYEDKTRPFNLPHYFILSASGGKVEDGGEYYCYIDWVRYYAPSDIIKEIPIESMTLSESAVSLNPDRVKELALTISPDYCTDYTMRWDSEERSIATFDGGNRIKAIKAGNVELTVTAKNGVTATCTLHVAEDVLNDATDIVLDYGDKNSGYVGETLTIAATVTPKWATYLDCEWETSDEAVATVKNGVVTFIGAGDVTITARAKDNSGITRSVELVSIAAVTDNINTDNCVAKYTRNGWADDMWKSDIESNTELAASYLQGSGYYFTSATSGNNAYTPIEIDTSGAFTLAERVFIKKDRVATGGSMAQILNSENPGTKAYATAPYFDFAMLNSGKATVRWKNAEDAYIVNQYNKFDVCSSKIIDGAFTEDVTLNLVVTHTAAGEWAYYSNGELLGSGTDETTAETIANAVLCLGGYPKKTRHSGDTFLYQALLAYDKAMTAEEVTALNAALDEMYA